MKRMTELEKEELKFHLTEAMEKFMQRETTNDNNLGWVPDNIEKYMSDAAFAVLMNSVELNYYLEDQGLLKE